MRTSPLPAEPAGSTSASPRQGCYLLHFEQPYRSVRHPGAQHYVGYADDIERRFQTHRKGHGSPVVATVLASALTSASSAPGLAPIATWSASSTFATAPGCAPSQSAFPGGAVVRTAGEAPEYVDLLAPAGATNCAELDLHHPVLIVEGEQLG